MIQIRQINTLTSILLVLLLNVSCKGEIKHVDVSVREKVEEKQPVKQVVKVAVNTLSRGDFDSLLNSGIIDNIDYKGDFVACYKILDKSGDYYLILTHDYDSKIIYSYYAEKKAFESKLIWDLNDSVVQKDYSEEYDINFLKDFIHVADLDNDELVDVVLTYKTKSKEDYDRLKIVIFHKNIKTVIDHEGASLDDERETKIGESFYSLPKSIKQTVFTDMKKLNSNVLSINSDVLEKIEANLN
ncbi:M949_RS01915 family surface polysaccharide biosynthesis protein [Aquimarina sp. 2-A2]|uniref:M949_RS01915 family surface polysaccharide biosynthesis protein n=1 Tax=Aquimarina sp. 2-A2 TaxID=3382644 RepID=UPI00387F2351